MCDRRSIPRRPTPSEPSGRSPSDLPAALPAFPRTSLRLPFRGADDVRRLPRRSPPVRHPPHVGSGGVTPARRELGRRLVPLALPVQGDFVAVGVAGEVERADARLVVDPAAGQAGVLGLLDPALEGLLAGGTQGRTAHPGRRVGGEGEAVVLVVVPGPQVDRVAGAAVLGQAEDLSEEADAAVQVGGEQFDVPEVGDVSEGRGHAGPPYRFLEGGVRLRPAGGRPCRRRSCVRCVRRRCVGPPGRRPLPRTRRPFQRPFRRSSR